MYLVCTVSISLQVLVHRCSVGATNCCGDRGVSSSYSNLLESAKYLCADILMSQQRSGGSASLRKSYVDGPAACFCLASVLTNR